MPDWRTISLRVVTACAVLLVAACSAPDPAPAPVPDAPAPPSDPLARGKELHETIGCATCHSLDGRKRTSGTYKGIYGTPVELSDGTTVMRDDAYLRRSILEPKAEMVKGYPDVMPDYSETLSAEDVDALIALIRSVGPDGESP